MYFIVDDYDEYIKMPIAQRLWTWFALPYFGIMGLFWVWSDQVKGIVVLDSIRVGVAAAGATLIIANAISSYLQAKRDKQEKEAKELARAEERERQFLIQAKAAERAAWSTRRRLTKKQRKKRKERGY